MGTSGAYGGSSKQSWKEARQLVLDFLSADIGGDPGSGHGPDNEPLDDLWTAIAEALGSDDPTLDEPSSVDTIAFLPTHTRSPSGSAGGSGEGGGAAGGQARSRGGRQGAGSRRQVTQGAARGGTALGAAYAVRSGDAEYLGELGLNLERLRGLSPVRQCAEILDAVLGEGAHPDELALRKASLEALKQILAAGDSSPDEATALRSFVVSYVFELSLVELQKQVNEGALSPSDVARKERTIRRYLEKRVASLPIPGGEVIKASELRLRAERLTKEVVKVLRADRGGTP